MLTESGEKMACEPCIRGHRVSGCNHKDRPLRVVAKKGRPVSQCVHCRNLRKNRASHVKCECGDKGHKAEECPHLLEIQATEHVCCCSHGKRCTCALKKDPSSIDELPEEEDGGGCCGSAPAKPHPVNTHSEPHLTVFANGHHKPVHNKNHEAIHQRAQPYRVPHRPHSIHGHQALTQQRSVDQLRNLQMPMTGGLPSSGDQDRGFNYASALGLQDERYTKSENVSPAPYGRQRSRTWQNQHNQQTLQSPVSFDMSSPTSPMFTGFNSASSYPYVPTLNTTMSNGDEAQAFSAVSEAHNVDWSGYSFPTPGQFNGYQEGYMAPPTSNPHFATTMERAASSSGAVSEYEYQAPYAVSNPGYSESNYAQSNADVSRPDLSRVDSSQSFIHNGPTSVPRSQASYFPETLSNAAPSLDYDRHVPESTASLSEIDRSSSGTGSPAREGNTPVDNTCGKMPTVHGFSVQDAQKLAHPSIARSVPGVSSDLLAQPASPWSHEVHDEFVPFVSGEELSTTEAFALQESPWDEFPITSR